jgi:RimJ/RimL family protein N-acetyltransferase
MAAAVPELDSVRLHLRAPRIGDFDAYATVACGPSGAFLGGPFDREGACADFCQMVAGWMMRGHGLWAIEDRATGTLQGFALYNHEYGDPEAEIGWLLLPGTEGRGIATEAAAMVRDFVFAQLGHTTAVSYIDPANARSIRLAERLGARRDAAAEAGLDEPVRVYRHGPEDRA